MIRHKLIKMMVAVGLIIATSVTTAFAATYGWEQKGNDWYYKGYDGSYVTGTVPIDNMAYRFDETGKMVDSWDRLKMNKNEKTVGVGVTTVSPSQSVRNEPTVINLNKDNRLQQQTIENDVQLTEDEFYNTAEKEMLRLVNEHRASLNLPAFRLSEELSQSAKWKSEDMVSRNYFAHNWEGVWYTDIIKNGCGIKIGSENIYYGSDYPNRTSTKAFAEIIARGMFGSWKNSPGHNKQMISTDYSEFGFGYSKNTNNGFLYGTQHFR